MRRLVRSVRAAAALACACAAAALGGTAATAAPPGGAIELSVDGQTWSADLAADLFDPAFRWVPGDTETASLLMRSRACPAASGQAEVTIGPEDSVLGDAFAVRTRVVEQDRTGGGTRLARGTGHRAPRRSPSSWALSPRGSTSR